jgi:hypothetical protein
MPAFQAPVLLDGPAPSGGTTVRLPGSGAVTQSILPWRWAFDWIGNQFSLFTINLGRSSAPEVESEILQEVGSYGRQLGRLGEALEVLIERLPRDQLSKPERDAIEAFSVQMREIKQIKERAKGGRGLTDAQP